MSESTTLQIERYLERVRGGDAGARQELLERACQRLLRLTRKMLPDYPRVRRWEDSGDVLQGAALRLCRALGEVTPDSARDFFRLAAQHIRWELLDLARNHANRHARSTRDEESGAGAALASAAAASSFDAGRLDEWTAFHEHVATLPDEEREVVDLLWYQGLSQVEAAALLGVSDRTVKRRWQAARLHLHFGLRGPPPL